MLARVRAVALPRLVREAEDRAWWAPGLAWAGHVLLAGTAPGVGAQGGPGAAPAHGTTPTVRAVTAADLEGLDLAPRVVAPFDPRDAHALLREAVLDGARVMVAVSGSLIVGVAVAAPSATEPAVESLLALGVAPAFRGVGLGTALLRALLDGRPPRTSMEARVGVAERDVVEPADVDTRLEIARRLLDGAGFVTRPTPPDLARDDPWTLVARLSGA